MSLATRAKKRSFHFLNITQFLGALNDNLFKLLVIFLLIHIKGAEHSSTIVSLAGAIFVIPFLFFSSIAGILADKLSKRNILVAMKFLEIVIMGFSIIAFSFHSVFWSYFLLFMMAFQSALFGPSKYGIIPEIVETHNVSKANGILTAATYLAMIIGFSGASFLADITNRNYVLCAFVCVFISILGFLASLKIEKTLPQRSTKKLSPFFLYEVYKSLHLSTKRPLLFWSILSSSFFLFVGAYVQLNAIPFAMESLNLSEIGGGYLFTTTAIGIALGAIFCGRLLKDRIELGLSCLTGFFMSVIFLLLWIFARFLYIDIALFVFLGFLGGMFVIPFDTFIQVRSPDQKRGQFIATNNFLSFLGVLFAAIFLFLISSVFEIKAASGFAWIGLLALAFNIYITSQMADLFFQFVAKKILLKFFYFKINQIPKQNAFIILDKGSWKRYTLMFTVFSDVKFLMPKSTLGLFRSFLKTFYFFSPNAESLDTVFNKSLKWRRKNTSCCLITNGSYKDEWMDSIQERYENIYYLRIKKEKIRKRILGYWYNKSQYSFHFQEKPFH